MTNSSLYRTGGDGRAARSVGRLLAALAVVAVAGALALLSIPSASAQAPNDDAPRLTGIHVLIGSGIGADADFGRLPKLRLAPRFDGLTYEFEAWAKPEIQDVTLFVTGGLDTGSTRIGLRGSLQQATVIRYGNALSQAISLSDGENVIEVERSLHGETSTYTVTVTRGLLPAPEFSVTRGARDGGPTITVTLAEEPLPTQKMLVQVRESTSDDWPAAAGSNLLPAGANASPFRWTFKNIRVSGLSKGTAYEVRSHLVDLDGTVISRSGGEVQVTTLSPAPAPTGLTLTPAPPGKGLSRTIAARWDAVDDGSPRMLYHLRWREAGQTPEAEWSDFGPFFGTSQVTSVLDEDGTYDVQVASDNGINPITWSEVKQATVNHSGGL